ncbi:MAG: hypothetical protein OXG96_14955 [Acidobacteria bacterium]|nr:hypothetical protein [Acidobacteriota bacterium]
MDNDKSHRPIDRLRIGGITASIWENQGANGDAKFYTARIERRYQDGDGNWKTTQSFGRNHLLAVAKLADQAHTRILALEQQESAGD